MSFLLSFLLGHIHTVGTLKRNRAFLIVSSILFYEPSNAVPWHDGASTVKQEDPGFDSQPEGPLCACHLYRLPPGGLASCHRSETCMLV